MQLVAAASAVALASAASPAAAQAPAGVTSPNVEFVRNLPMEGGAASATIVGNRLYAVGWSTLAIFDASDPANPVPLSEVPLGFQFPHEDVDTNGKVLVLGETNVVGFPPPPGAPPAIDRFHIWDVSDPRRPTEIATLASKGDRSLTCVFGCAYAYGGSGTILALDDPRNPRVVGDWGTDKPTGRGFDVTEARPGLILTSTRPMMLLDARENPANPRLVATGVDPAARMMHFVQWPQAARDRFVLSSVETFGKPRCDATSGPLITWEAAGATAGELRIIDEFRLPNGTGADGRPASNKLACSAHVFDAHPDFANGGLVALGHFDHGTRLVQVDASGKMAEVGFFMPYTGQTLAARWGSDDVIYGIDLERGIDVLRYKGPIPAPDVGAPAPGGGPTGGASRPPAAPQGASCPRGSRLTVRLPRRLRRAVVYLNGRRIRVARRQDLRRRRTVLRKLPAGRLRVRVVGRTKAGRRVSVTRRYPPCGKRSRRPVARR